MKTAGVILLFVFSPLLMLVACVLATALLVPTAPLLLAGHLLNRRHQRRMGILPRTRFQPQTNPANN